jgi:tetratricopeptide (TPR) repeat protein
MDRRPWVVAAVVSVVSLSVAAGAVLTRSRGAAVSPDREIASCGMPLGPSAASRLPKGTVLLESAEAATVTGKAVCGHCAFGVGESCNTMIWNHEGKHAIALVPGEKLAELQTLVGTCASGNHTVTARGTLTTYRGMNYLLVSSYQTAAQGKVAPTTEVGKRVAEGVAARYDRKDLAAAEAAWREAIPLLDAPDATALDRYQTWAGLGLLHGERKEYEKAKELFEKAAQAALQIEDNPRPKSYSYFNLACAEGYLGDADGALQHLRLALEAERHSARRRYSRTSRTDDCFASIRDDARFEALLEEFDG